MDKLSEREKQLMIDNVKANFRMEGYEVSPEDEKLFHRYLDGECTLEELLEGKDAD